jgi:hypothetical protein
MAQQAPPLTAEDLQAKLNEAHVVTQVFQERAENYSVALAKAQTAIAKLQADLDEAKKAKEAPKADDKK